MKKQTKKVTVKQIVDSPAGFKRLLKLRLPGKLVFDIQRFIAKKINPQIEIYASTEKSLLRQYGVPVIENNIETGKFTFKSKEDFKKFEKEIKPLQSTEIELNVPVIDFDEIVKRNPELENSNDLLLIHWMFKED